MAAMSSARPNGARVGRRAAAEVPVAAPCESWADGPMLDVGSWDRWEPSVRRLGLVIATVAALAQAEAMRQLSSSSLPPCRASASAASRAGATVGVRRSHPNTAATAVSGCAPLRGADGRPALFTDLTVIRTREGFLRAAVVLDAHSRQVISGATDAYETRRRRCGTR